MHTLPLVTACLLALASPAVAQVYEAGIGVGVVSAIPAARR